jgi:hypothetical protein
VRIAPLDFYSASGRFDFLTSASAHFDSANRKSLRRVAIGEKLGWTLSFADQSRLCKRLFRHFGAFRQPGKVVETHDLMLNAKDIGEPTLWNAARERHLTALELWLSAARSVVSRACLDSLVSFARCLTSTRARAAAKSLAIPVRSGSRDEIVKADFL